MTSDKIRNLSLFSKYKDIDDKIISEFISSVPESFSEAFQILSSFNKTVDDFDVLSNRVKIQKSITDFHHSADTITNEVNNGIKLLNLPDTQIFVTTHQPNLFAYSGVFRKIVLIQTLKNEIERQQKTKRHIVNVFIIIDHDFMNEIWIRRAQLPSIRHTKGILEIKLSINKSNKWNMVCKTPLPRREIMDYWKKQIKSWIKNLSTSPSLQSSKKDLFANFEELWMNIESSYSNSKTYSDFNSFLISQIVNKIWGYDVLFTRLSDISSVFETGYRHLIQNIDRYTDALRKAEISLSKHNVHFPGSLSKHNVHFPGIGSDSNNKSILWIHCKCGSKAAAKLYYSSDDQVQLAGVCISCKNNLRLHLGKKNELEGLKGNLDNVSPKAIPILLLLSKCLDSVCYASGSGGVDYMVFGSGTFKSLNIEKPVNIFWPGRDVYDGIGQIDALQRIELKSQSDIDVYLDSLREKEKELGEKIKPLLEERAVKIRSGQQIEKLLSDLFILKQEQRENRIIRKVTENVRSTINLTPCIIDYAVNFGIKNMELQWRENLIKKDNFTLALKLSMGGKYHC